MNATALRAKGFSTTGEPFKKPMTAYMCFLKEQTALISQQSSQVLMKDLVRLGSTKWNSMTD